MTSQTSAQTVQFVLWPQPPPWPRPSVTDWSTSLCVDERRASQIGRFAGSVTPAAQQGEADRKHAVADGSRVGSRAGEQEKEELQVWQQEDRRPHPDRKWWQARADALRPAVGEGRSRGAGPTSLHVLQTEAVNFKDIIHRHDAEQQVESHTHPSHPLTEVHHPPYCRENNQYSINNQSIIINTARNQLIINTTSHLLWWRDVHHPPYCREKTMNNQSVNNDQFVIQSTDGSSSSRVINTSILWGKYSHHVWSLINTVMENIIYAKSINTENKHNNRSIHLPSVCLWRDCVLQRGVGHMGK